MTTVAELVKYLQTFPPETPVAYEMFSEQVLLQLKDIKVKQLCELREDGWLQNARPDRENKTYIVFPGN